MKKDIQPITFRAKEIKVKMLDAENLEKLLEIHRNELLHLSPKDEGKLDELVKLSRNLKFKFLGLKPGQIRFREMTRRAIP